MVLLREELYSITFVVRTNIAGRPWSYQWLESLLIWTVQGPWALFYQGSPKISLAWFIWSVFGCPWRLKYKYFCLSLCPSLFHSEYQRNLLIPILWCHLPDFGQLLVILLPLWWNVLGKLLAKCLIFFRFRLTAKNR